MESILHYILTLEQLYSNASIVANTKIEYDSTYYDFGQQGYSTSKIFYIQ